MATQTFELQWNDTPAGKTRLNKTEIIDYCRHFGQATPELDAFLARFDFDEWICMELFVDYVYGKYDKSGSVGADCVEYLNLISTTFFTEEAELALQNYLGFNKKFAYPNEERPSFQFFDDCPLWIVQITGRSKHTSSAVFFMPAVFWKDAQLTSESYGYSKYGIADKYNSWYRDAFGKNRSQNHYWRNRIGAYSPNFINRDTDAAIDFEHLDLSYDRWENRVLHYDYRSHSITYYDLSDPKTKNTAPGFQTGSNHGHIEITPDAYLFYHGDQLITTDKNFNKISETKTKTVNQFENEYWNVVLDSKGILMTQKQAQQEKRFKYSELKLTTSIYSNNPKDLSILANSNDSVIFFGNKFSVVNKNFEVNNIAIDALFKKEIPVCLYGGGQREAVVSLSGDRQLFFSGKGVFELGTDEKPKYLNDKLSSITGEVEFFNAIKDEALNGIWFIAGYDRLVFTDENLETGYVFNFIPQFTDPDGYDYRYCNLFFDNQQNLWYSLFGGKLYKIDRSELEAKLKTAVPYSG